MQAYCTECGRYHDLVEHCRHEMGEASKFRLFAAMLDSGLAALVALVPAAKIAGLPDTARWALAITLYLAYYFLQESFFSTTLGKRVFGLCVVRLDGFPARWRESSVRTLTRVLEVNPLLFGGLPAGLTIAFTRKRQRLGDILARTLVIRGKSRGE
jgi:uncharacterized RDD family membrane protein YckC